eukprot:9007_1
MNQQPINAFNDFDSTLSNAIDTLHDTLQSTNSLSAASMYTDQFNEIITFQEKTKAFTQFLKEQSDYHRFQYSQFKASQKHHTKASQRSTVSSQISIQSTPQSLNDWSYNANDGGSAPDPQIWRGYDPQPTAYNIGFGLFNDADIDIIPFKVIDTDNDSECTENIDIIPSLPPSVASSISVYIDSIANNEDDRKEMEQESVANLYLYEEDIDEDAEDDEKWDDALIKTHAFAGFFEQTAPTAQVEFKNDNVVKPNPTKWQEREEENKQIIHLLERKDDTQPTVNDINDADAYHQTVPIVEAAVESTPNIDAYGEEEEDLDAKRSEAVITPCYAIQNNKCNAMLGLKSRRSMHKEDQEQPGLLSNDVRFSTQGGAPPPIAFIQYERPKQSVYDKIEDHPHYHPLLHGEEGKVEEDEVHETAIHDGERDAPNDKDETRDVWFDDECANARIIPSISGRSGIHIVENSINGLRDALDHHFHRNHSDFIDIKQVLYSLSGQHHRHSSNHNNEIRKHNRKNQEHWRTRKKNKTEHK